MSTYSLTFLTPLFSKGSYDDKPEIRPPSIRGQIHWWFRALGGKYDDEKAIFGGVHNGTMASKIVVRVSNVCGQSNIANTLPHKNGGLASPKAAYMPDCSFTLHIRAARGLADHQQASSERYTLGSSPARLASAPRAAEAHSSGTRPRRVPINLGALSTDYCRARLSGPHYSRRSVSNRRSRQNLCH